MREERGLGKPKTKSGNGLGEGSDDIVLGKGYLQLETLSKSFFAKDCVVIWQVKLCILAAWDNRFCRNAHITICTIIIIIHI